MDLHMGGEVLIISIQRVLIITMVEVISPIGRSRRQEESSTLGNGTAPVQAMAVLSERANIQVMINLIG